MEPHSAHAQWDKESGRLTIWVANDAPFRALHEITEALNMTKDKIRLINPAQIALLKELNSLVQNA